MNATKDGLKYRQLHIEDYLQMVLAEQGEYAGVYAHGRIAENNHIITEPKKTDLLEKMLQENNLKKAYKKVKSNKGAGGIDGMEVEDLQTYLEENQEEMIRKIRAGKYKPSPVLRVEIPKEEKGKVRKLGIPTVVDRVIQQAITEILYQFMRNSLRNTAMGSAQKGAPMTQLNNAKRTSMKDIYL